MNERATQVLVVVAAFLAGLIACFAIIVLVSGRSLLPSASGVATSAVGGPFQLVDQDGRTVTDRDMQGRPFLVFFGYTHCPDICPTTLFEVSEVLNALGPDAKRVGALFVTVDPERDTPATLKDYLSSFHPTLRGLSGSPDAIAKIEREYRVYAKKVPLDGGEYSMDHTAMVYLMDKDGRFVAPFSLKRRPEDAAADLRRYL